MPQTPEQIARQEIDVRLAAAGWLVQRHADMNLAVGRGIAVCEFPMKPGFGSADYLLYVDRKAVGAIEAKAEGTLAGVEVQTAKYAAGLPDRLPAHRRPLPFLFEANAALTFFTNGLDPAPRSRRLFSFPQPETLARWVAEEHQLRGRLNRLPPLDTARLWSVQSRAIAELEASLARADPRALVQMATGSGKTFTAVNTAYRLLKFGQARRILFLVDRGNLAKQAEDEFNDFEPPDDPRKFPALYTVQRLKGNAINPAAKVVITTIQRLFSMLKGDAEFDEGNEQGSAFDTARPPWQGEPPAVAYNAAIPPEFFDVVVVDECHRSIYELWAQVLLYFDAFLVGLTATPSARTIAFFQRNLVMQYGHAEAVADGVNVDFDVFRIRTRITEAGATIAGGADVYVEKRHKLTRAERLARLDEDLTYTANQLDRDIVAEDQIRTVLAQFRDAVLPQAFAGRTEVPKTLIFAKDDSHADDIVRIAREVFHEGNDFCQKITYRTGFTKRTRKVEGADGSETEVTDWVRTSQITPDEILGNFRNSYSPRIAVTVDMIATGTDVKPIECVFFLRNVKSAGFFEQMKGRGVRVISPDKLRGVTPSARLKDRFIIVDAVGVCEQDKTDSQSLNRQPSATLEQVLTYVAQGGLDPDALTTLAGRLARLQREFTPEQLTELQALAGGNTLADIAHELLHACDADAQRDAAVAAAVVAAETAAAKAVAANATPGLQQIDAAAEHLAQAAVTPLLNPALRHRILELQRQHEQTLDRHTLDDVLDAGFDAQAVAKAQAKVEDFRAWIDAHRDELTALQLLYAGTRPLKLSLKDLRQLRDAIALPPLAATPVQLWRAYQAVEGADAVRSTGGEMLTDLVHLVRHALLPSFTLVPYRDELRQRYQQWLAARGAAGTAFSAEQQEWLDRMAEHIATSLAIARDDFDTGWFGQHGSLGRAYELFGAQLQPLMDELNERLAA